MLKYIPVAFAIIALGVVAALDFMGFRGRSAEIATLHEAATKIDAGFEVAEVSYKDHLLSKIGMAKGLPNPTLATARLERRVLRSAPLNSYLPTPSEEVLAGWERLAWSDDFQTGFGWPDGITDGKPGKYAPNLDDDIAIYLNGRSSIYMRVERAEPTMTLANRLKQAYWVVDTGRSLDRLHEGRPRASYFWTNFKETSSGNSVYNAKYHKHFHKVEGVHWLSAKNKSARRDEKMRYMFASLGGGVVLKLRAHASEAEIKQVMDAIDYQSLNQMQTLPSPLIAEGLGKYLIDTPEEWLSEHAGEVPTASYGTDVGQTEVEAKTIAQADQKTLPKAHKGGFGSENCSAENGKTCKVLAH
ncbi:hypothetical protein [Cognatishimia activa]|uniref:Uncharacterized protein n=1 Tax=Cognatishimia activa TaxID=1715691 RepID=A0A0P1IPS4_9RHOB|nr:hypothetical protein [Cognatishimia activa]CUI87387.1 hypothetical protein TA5113_01672 [Cognatishimia activa]CUK25611.1 hypothetical protein TA5114_01412 [Cognatishimia activa]